MNQIDMNLFFELCNTVDPNLELIEEKISNGFTPELLGYLFYNRMQGAAYYNLVSNNLLSKLNRELRTSLSGAYYLNIEKNQIFFTAINLLSSIFHGKQIPFLKGAKLCDYYPKGVRTSNDIDVLVLPEDLSEIDSLLLSNEFKQGKIINELFHPATRREIIESRMLRGETVPYIRQTLWPNMRFIEVDINFSLDYKNGNKEILRRIIDNAGYYHGKYIDIYTLSNEDFFIHLCCHLFKEATTLPWIVMRRDMTLYKYSDIYLLLCSFERWEIEDVFTRSKELGLDEICGCAIIWTLQLFNRHNKFAEEKALQAIDSKKRILDAVYDPQDNQKYFYVESDIRSRFFSNNRVMLIEDK